MPATEAAWDFAARDLQAAPFNYDASTAFMIANKVFYQGSGNVGNWHACSCPSTSDGCGSTNAYMQWLAADDDNGNINDGTPHMTALYAAFARHGIACATPVASNGGCASGPTAAPVVTVAPGSNQVVLSWGAVAGATQYWVMRTEGFAGCEFGKALVATVTGTSYTDSEVANGRTYSYNVVAVGSSTACFGRASACAQATPQPCAGSISLDKSVYNCADSVGISLVDSDLSGSGTAVVSIASSTELTGENVTLSESPAGSGQFTGSIATSTVPAATGDNTLSVGNGDTITVTYVDVSYCGTPNVPVTATAPTDCAAPLITNVFADTITGSQATVHWSTNEIANGLVRYGRVVPPASSSTDNTLVTTHAQALRSLSECSKYYYSVQSADPAGNVSLSDNGGSYFTFTTGKNVNPSYASYDTPVAIPDNNTTGASSIIAVADTNTVLDVNVTVNLTHTYDGDITLYLIGPNGATVTLSNKRGSSGDNYTNTVFDDGAATAIASGAAPFTGTFRPDSPLSVFNNLPATGNWTLKVVDSASSDIGTIQNWTLQLLYPEEDCGATLRLDANAYNCGNLANISVKDTTLTGQPSLTVTIASNTETAPETVTLVAQPAPHEDTFTGSIQLSSVGPSNGDSLLSVIDSDTITVSYIDVDDGTGGQNILHTDTATTDCIQPVISNVASSSITGNMVA
jgi:subtilisin-like proprotein convertase family protein